MEDILNKFNELVQEMANAVAEASSPEEAEKLQAEWDKKIDKAEKEMEEEVEAFIKTQDDALLAEQKASEEEQKELEEARDKLINAQGFEKLTKTQLREMKEKDVVSHAISLGIEAKISDRKNDTINKILAYTNNL